MNADDFMGKLKKYKEEEQSETNQLRVNQGSSLTQRVNALRHQLSPDEKEFIQYMSANLPPVIGRAEVDRFLPGLVKRQTLAQAGSAGIGPQIAWRVGRKVAYRTDSLLLWIVGRLGITRLVDMSHYINLS